MKIREGDSIGGYELIDKLGFGGNGAVWRAARGSQDVAMKILQRRKGDGPERFDREIQALRSLSESGSVIPILDDGVDNERRWYTMPIAVPLREDLGPTATLTRTCARLAEVSRCLAGIHAAGYAHRDIKPDNLLVHEDVAKLGDMGLVALPEATTLTLDGGKLGPAHFIAPEMLNSAASSDPKQADIYSLGKTLWVFATGQTYPLPGPHDASYGPVAIQAFVSSVWSAHVNELVRRMTHLDPKRRPVANEVTRELEAVVDEPEKQGSEGLPSEQVTARLRAVLSSKKALEAESGRQVTLAKDLSDQLRSALGSASDIIQTTLRVSPRPWRPLDVWRPRPGAHRADTVILETEGGVEFLTGASLQSFNWSLCLGYRMVLLSSEVVHIDYGFHLQEYIGNKEHSNMRGGGPRVWKGRGDASNGSPQARALVSQVESNLRAHIDPALQAYLSRLEEANG